ncbi:MAG: hypothetical protein IJ647_04355, partial [Prevotella sp.]|nr:hypothetical protein [Prevotella sp.]
EDFNVKEHLKALHIRFLPDQTQEDNLSSREFLKKAEFVNIKTLLSGGDEEADSSGSSGGQTGGTDDDDAPGAGGGQG